MPKRAVTKTDISNLYEATRGTPEANQLQDILEIFDEQEKDFARAVEIIGAILTRYERRHLRVFPQNLLVPPKWIDVAGSHPRK